ncbi:hypothetical protein JCM8097_002904 [Rhodosporidiobolus ruineniae]
MSGLPEPSQPAPDASSRLTKRKVLDAVSALDSAFKDPGQSVAAKKRKTSSSNPPRTSTPALEAILARSSTSRSASPAAPPPASYDPTSLPSLLARLSSYRLTSFSPSKPASLSALQCALHGWKHTPATKERVECVTCGRGVVLLPPAQGGWASPAGVKLREEYERALFSSRAEESLHKETCPWRMRPCARSLYRLPGGGLGVSSGGRRRLLEVVAAEGREMQERGLGEMRLEVPKDVGRVMTEGGRERLVKAVQAVVEPSSDAAADSSTAADRPRLDPTTLLLALFGWSLSPATSSSSAAISSSRPGTPSLSRSASSSSLSSLRSIPPSSSSSGLPILGCGFCHRQVLASSYLPSPASSSSDAPPSAKEPRAFDPVKQHLPFCPFVDAYAGLPTHPSPGSSAPTSPVLSPLTSRAADAAKNNPATAILKPGWQTRLEAVLQRPLSPASAGSVSGVGPGAGAGAEEGAVGQAGEGREGGRAEGLIGSGKTKELLTYVRTLLGPKIKVGKALLPPLPSPASERARQDGGETGEGAPSA